MSNLFGNDLLKWIIKKKFIWLIYLYPMIGNSNIVTNLEIYHNRCFYIPLRNFIISVIFKKLIIMTWDEKGSKLTKK
ncbi:hypothetical protein C1645_767427 [Glomus cerebriforme]|uniref:Uncharacterized protein n=1 Tax=Glomus cerebriforme TaxID=658196 RepID=A0A397T8Y8_9GLOM|nr:hypothetical protein C1645_767427 [Glomus cerebriforme]